MYGLSQMLVAVIVASIGSVGLWTFAAKLVERWFGRRESEISRLRERHDACEEKVATLENEVSILTRRLDAVERHNASWVPRWIRDAKKRIEWVNDAAMLAIFAPLGLSRDDVEGCTFGDLLDATASAEIDRLDRSALAHPGKAVSTMLMLHPSLRPMTIVKVAGVGHDRELIYEGYAYFENHPDDVADRAAQRQEEQIGLSTLRKSGSESEADREE